MTGNRLIVLLILLLGGGTLAFLILRPHADVPGRTPETGGVPASEPLNEPNNGSSRAVNKSNQESVPGSSLLGSVVAMEQASLSVRIPMRIARVFAVEGTMARAGQELVRLDDSELVTQGRTAQAAVDAARAQVAKAEAGRSAQKAKADSDLSVAKNGLVQAQTRWQQAQLQRDAAADDLKAERRTAEEGVHKAELGLMRSQEVLRGLEDLAKVGGVSRSDLEGARTQAKVAQSDVDTAKAQAQRLEAGRDGLPYKLQLAQKDVDAALAGVQQAKEGVRAAEEGRKQALAVADQDIRSAQSGVRQAQAGTAGAQASLRQTHLFSPIAGLVAGLTARVGETAQPGSPLVTIVSLTALRVEALVPARLLSSLHIGQAAQISVDTQGGKAFDAAISEIARIAEPDGRTFRVRFRLLNAPLLRPGQAARIRVQSERKG